LADFKLGLGFEDVMVVLSNLPFHFHFRFRFPFFLDIFFFSIIAREFVSLRVG